MKRLLAALLLIASPAAAQNYLPAAVKPVDCSKTTAGANQTVTLLTAGQAAHGFRIQNISTAEPVWWSVTGATMSAAGVMGSFVLPPGAATTFAGVGTAEPGYGFGTGNALTAFAVTTGHIISCIYW